MDEQVIAVMVLEVDGHTLDVNIPMDRGRMTTMVQESLEVEAPSEAEVVFVNSDLPFISADLGADADMLNDLASLAAGLTDEQREAAVLYWNNAISVSEQGDFRAAANVLMQASEIERWRAYDYYEPEAGWARPLSREEKYGRTWLESAYSVPQIAYNNYDLESFGQAHSDGVILFDDGYLDAYANYPAIEDFDRGQMNDALDSMEIPSSLEAWQKVRVTARSLYNGREFTETLPMSSSDAMDFESRAELGGEHDYEIVELEDGGVLDRLGIDPSRRNYDMLTSLNGVVAMAAARLEAGGDDYARVSALLSEFPDPTYMDVAGAIEEVGNIPFHGYEFPNMDFYDLANMSKEEKWGRTYYAQIAEEGGNALPEGLDTYNELLSVDFKPEMLAEAHNVSIGNNGYYDAYAGDELDLTYYDDEEIADAAKEAREKIGIADTQVLRDTEQPVAHPYIPAPSEPYATQYRMLSRMKGDFDYVLGEGGIGALRQIWDSDGPGSQVAYMRRLLAEIPDEYAPEWISAADIDNYEQRINELVAEQNSELLGRSESSLAAEALDEAQRIMEDIAEDLPEDEPVLSEQEVREMMEDAAMGRGEDLRAGAEERRAVRSVEEIDQGMQNVIERLNRIARPWAIFAEPIAEGHRAGMVSALIDTDDPNQYTRVQVIYDYDEHPEAIGAEDSDIEASYAERWAAVYSAIGRSFPGRDYSTGEWTNSIALEEALKIAEVPDTRASELLSANRDAAATLVSAPDNFGNSNLSDELQESKVKQLEWKPGSIAVGRTTGMPYVVLAVTEDGRLRLGADLSIYDSDMFEQGGQVDEALVESYRQGRDDGTVLARALAEATGRPEVVESRIEDLAREQLAKPSNENRPEQTSNGEKGPWKVGSIAIGRQSGYAFVVMDVTEDGRLLLGADAYVASPDMFEYGGQVPDQVMDDLRSGSITEEELQEVLAEIRGKAERDALTGPQSEQPTWKVGSVAMDRDTRESHLVTGLTASGNILIGYDMEPASAAAYQNVGEVDEGIALGYRNGTINNDEKNRAMAAVVSEYVSSSRDAGDLTEEEIADIERGAEEDFGDLYAHNAAMSREESKGISFGSEEPKGTNEGLRIDPERSRWYINGREGWEFPVYVVGNNESNEPSAVCGIEMSPEGSFVAIVELNGEQRPDLSPKSSFPTFNRAREAGMLSLGSALGLAPEVLAPYVHGEVAPDPYPEAWARDEGVKMTAEQIMAKYGFDPDVEYVRIYPDGQWEALYYNPQGNEERGQIVQAWGGDLGEVLTEYNPENAAWISTADGRNNDLLYDWPNDMETVLDGFMRNRQEYVGFAEGNPEAQHAYLVEREAHLESMRTLDTERSDIFEDIPGQEYQMVAVAVGDEESEHAYVANLKLGDDGWSVRVAYDNDNAFQASNGIASFEEAREKAMRMFRAGGRYDAQALDNFEGFQKDFAAVDDKSQELGRRSYESILMNDEWGWEVTPAGVGRLMDQNGEIYAEIHPDRKQVVIMNEPIPGATTWTVDNDDVRIVLEACAIQEAGLEFEPPEGATFDGLIYDVSKTLAKEESLIPPRIAGAFDPLSSRERFSNDLDELFEAYDNNLRFSPLETIYISDTPGILVSLGMEQRPIHLNALHALNIIAPKNERNSHHHGITREEMEGLPDLIARPAVITDALNGATSSDAVVLVLPSVDSDNQPLLAVIRPNEDAQYELETINMNRLASVYGKRNAENFLANAAEQGKVLYIDQKETEELSKVSQLQLLKSLAGLPFNEIIRRSSVIDKAEGRDVSATVVSAEDRPTTVDAMKVIEEANERLRAEQTAQIEESLAESDVLQHREGVVRHEEPALADRLKAAVVGALAWTVVSAPAAAAEVQTPTGTYVAQASDDLIELKGRLARSLDEALPAGWVIDDVAPSKDMLALEMTITSGEVDVELGVVAPRDKTTTTEENLDDLSSRLLEAAAEAMVGEMAAEAYIASSRRRDAKDVLGEEDLGAIDAASATVETQRRGQTAYMHVGDDILAQTGDNPQLYTRLAARNGEDFFVDDNGHEIVSLKNGSIVEGEEAASRMNEMLAAYANHPNPGTVEFQNEFTYISKTLQESEIPPSAESPDMVEGNQENKRFFQRMRETFGSRRQEKESESREHSARRTDEETATQTAVLASALAAASAMEVPMVAAAEEKSKDGGRRKVEVEGYVTRETVKNATLKSDEVEARAGAAKVKKAAPAPQQAQKRQ